MQLKVPRKIRQYFMRHIWSHVPRKFNKSPVSISVLIPLAAKDIDNAALSVKSVRECLLHPIDQIIIVGQNDKRIEEFCKFYDLKYINEEDILSAEILELKTEINGKNNNGWIRQQLIKLNAFDYADAENILVHDADTIFVRPISFIDDRKRQILFSSDEYIENYHKMTRHLIGPINRYPRSFIAHGMLFQRDLMSSLHQKIYSHCQLDINSAVAFYYKKRDGASLSEYELYGNYLFNFHKERVNIKYWFNYQITKSQILNMDNIKNTYSRFNSVSYHIRPNHTKKPRLYKKVIATLKKFSNKLG